MAQVLLTIDEVGVAIEVQERLEREGHAVTWDTARRGGHGDGLVDVVVIPGGSDLGARVEAWRKTRSVPAIIVLGEASDVGRATQLGLTALLSTEPLVSSLEQALANRFGTAISANVGRAALGLDERLTESELAVEIIRRGRDVSAAIVRGALESRRFHYVTATSLCEPLRAARALDVPEIEIVTACSGARTLKSVIAASQLPALEAGQRCWALACAGAIRFDPEPLEGGDDDRRRVRSARAHIRARDGLPLPTAYDVLDVTRGAYVEDVEEAVAALGLRYAPTVTAILDLGDLGAVAGKQWERIVESRAALYYEESQKPLEAFIDRHLAAEPGSARLATSWGRADLDPRAAAAAFARGQAALSAGEAFKALSEMATAARAHPRHPTYEAYLAWARYRSDVARGADRAATARKERGAAEAASLGRRPFAQALVAIGLLCVADGDAAAARWHLTESLRINPELPAAQMILRRLV